MRVRWKTGYHTALVLATMVCSWPLAAQTGDNSDSRWLEKCKNQSDYSDRETYCELRVVQLGKSTGSVSVDGRENGGVKIVGWDGDSVVVHILVEAQANTQPEAQELAKQVQVVTSSSPIHAEGPSSGHRIRWSVNYRIYVPRHTDLTLLTKNGPVSVQDVAGRMDLSATNGPVDLDGIGGDVHARAQNGPLDVTLTGAKWNGAGLDAETRNGPVDLTVPKGYAAHLETGTVNGPMDIDFPITIQGTYDPRRLSMDIGGGGAPVRVVTTNGPLSVRQE